MMQKKIGLLQIVNIAGFIMMLTTNFLANYLPIGGKTTGEVSAQYQNLFVPAGYTFSIWGLIYLMLFAFIIYQARGLINKEARNVALHCKIGWWFFLSTLFNTLWIFAWHHNLIFLSVVIIILLLLSIIMIYLNLKSITDLSMASKEFIFAHAPFSVYLGWVTVATIANISAFLSQTGWNRFGFSEMFWFTVVLLVCTVITLIVMFRRKDILFGLVAIWAFIGIFAANLAYL